MSAHQIITGALNRGENVYATGSVDGLIFTVCAVGPDVVILGADFSRIQVIPGASHNSSHLVTSVSCCSDSGKIAATYGNVIRIFEPTNVTSDKSRQMFNYQWLETQCFTVKDHVNTVLWNMDGLRLLVVIDDELTLYQHRSVSVGLPRNAGNAPVMFCIAEDEQSKDFISWDIIWTTKIGLSPKYIRYSPDGAFLAISGDNDVMVRIYYQEPDHNEIAFNCVTLHHPSIVCGFEWRRIGRYMPRKCVQSVLISWCEDNTSRIWKETPPPELSIVDITGDGGEPAWERMKPKKFFGKHFRVKKAKNRIMNKLKSIVPEKKKKEEGANAAVGLRAQIMKSPSFSDLQTVHQTNGNVQFHLAASINAETDCLLVPSMDDADSIKRPLCVHWLNNKELVFGMGAEKLLAEAIIIESDNSMKRSATMSPMEEDEATTPSIVVQSPNGVTERPQSAFGGSVCSDSPSSKDILDVKLEILLRQWSRSNDVLFAVHPVDGSLLTWTVEWLDDYHRQPTVSFTSRFPTALPVTDASSLRPSLSTFNPHEPMYIDVLRRENDAKEIVYDRLLERRISNTIHLLTNHENGSLNLWHMAMDENSQFTTILNVTHISRMCGHRFKINQIVAHSVLPLLLTTSQFKDSQAPKNTSGSLSEVILWKIAPVGPLCKSGGVMELARVASPSKDAFAFLAWIPTILPSCTLGTVCNSPSSCFLASDGRDLIVYQAVVDARGLLSEIHANQKRATASDDGTRSLTPSPRRDADLVGTFKVVSTQSTAKPGCVLEIGRIENALNTDSSLLLLHVFNEHLVLHSNEAAADESQLRMGTVLDRSKSSTFHDRFLVVMLEKRNDGDRFVMHSLVISSQSPQPIPTFDEDVYDGKGFLRPASPVAQSVAKLYITSEKICDQDIPLPGSVKITSIAPAAGHLPSSSLYPACEAPYVLVTACDDDIVRFWRCVPNEDGEIGQYQWREWNMITDNRPSEIELEGSIYSISAAHSGRLACAYDPRTAGDHSSKVEVGVYECESSGGVEWLREDTISIKDIQIPPAKSPNFVPSPLGSSQDLASLSSSSPSLAGLVRIDWVSTEDGSHILTVGVAASVFLYTQISQDPAQQNVTLMKDSDTTLRRPSLRKASSLMGTQQSVSNRLTRWVCTRVLALQSADGLPPVPSTISWARDGLLIVGMLSEMRVYNQWNLTPKKDLDVLPVHIQHMKSRLTSAQPLSLVVSASHSMLDQLAKKKDNNSNSNKSRTYLDMISKSMNSDSDPQSVLEALSREGLFEAARMSSPILPQYHPKQLIVLLNGGKTRRVKAILLHVLRALKERQSSMHNPLSRAASVRRMSTVEGMDEANTDPSKISIALEDDSLDYDEIDNIAPLPLYALIAADNVLGTEAGERAEHFDQKEDYDSLFATNNVDDNLDDMLMDNESGGGRSRHSSTSEAPRNEYNIDVLFSAKHNRILTELLTHTHLPGLSSVDQMHLLAIADTLSHFSSDVIDKLTQANAAMKPVVNSFASDSAAGGYATAASGMETVDECGLRFLMAMKQHEYLLLCLPIKQRMDLKRKGLSSSHVIWAQHSDTETELLNAIPGIQKASPSWEELRTLGVAWWLKNTASLRICVEQLAKTAFQQNQDPMDASLFYLALRKKNVLTHLFKTSRNKQMSDFFMNDFNQDHWKKVAAKNAFVLMSKQRFQHAAAFFLLSGSLKDAVQTVLCKCNDLQLAMVILRLYETDPDQQQKLLKEMLCREVLGQSIEDFDTSRGQMDDDVMLSKDASKDPFERSMAYWLLKDYSRAAHTLVEEAHVDRSMNFNTNLSDIFNFYCFLRKHPLVVRQRLTDAGAQVGSTEKFLSIGKQLDSIVTPAERRLFFRTAAEHMARGCPMLALDVLSRLPKNISLIPDGTDSLRALLNVEGKNQSMTEVPSSVDMSEPVDWSQPTAIKTDELDLQWSDDDDDVDEYGEKIVKPANDLAPPTGPVLNADSAVVSDVDIPSSIEGPVDMLAQHLKFVASLRILTEELSTLASGFEVYGGQLRYQLLSWLEKEVNVLKMLCDYQAFAPDAADSLEMVEDEIAIQATQALHEVLKSDHMEMEAKVKFIAKRRKWLIINQKLIRSFASYCALHSAQNHRLTSALMELLLLLLDVQKDAGLQHLSEVVPDTNSFPLLVASVSSTKMFVSSPLSFIENQCSDLLSTMAEMQSVPNTENHLQKAYMLYNLSQGLSSCLYQSLSDVEQINLPSKLDGRPGILARRSRTSTCCEDIRVTTAPARWPGVDTIVALMGREKDDETPQLRLLLAECFVAISMSLFCFALAAHDARWLYRMAAHQISPDQFALIFGGGGEQKLKAAPPTRPPRPAAPAVKVNRTSESNIVGNDVSEEATPTADGGSLRSRFHSRVFGASGSSSTLGSPTVNHNPTLETTVMKWVAPHKNIVEMYAEKPQIAQQTSHFVDYDSDDDNDSVASDDDDGVEHANISSFAWQLLRLALIEQQRHRLSQFLVICGFDPNDIPGVAPRVEDVLRLLESWSLQIKITLKEFPGGCPIDLIPNMMADVTETAPSKKYAVLLEKNNTPFEAEARRLQPLKRLWTFLINEEHLFPIFVRYLFLSQGQMETAPEKNDALAVIDNQPLPEAFKIMQKDSEPIVAFACNQEKPGWIVVSTGRELQEIDISGIFDESGNNNSWIYNRTDLDMQLFQTKRDQLKENDDYQLFSDSVSNGKNATMMFKRTVTGIRRIDSHPTAPFYATGSSDGSIRVWEWGVGQPVYTARVAGQHAKVSKISFSCNGNKFAAVDGDGMLCLWQASQSSELKKPFFSQRCHNKSASDVRFLGHTSSVLITAGCSSGDCNLALWDTLLPQNRALVHAWQAHPDGASCVIYLPHHQTIVSGGRHGELCFWDVRQRQLRNTVKAFDAQQIVKSLVTDYSQDLIVVGSSEGDIKIFSADCNPQLMYSLPGEHAAKGGFSFRQVGQSTVQGVQQLYIDQHMRMFSCGADATLKFRTLPSVYNMTNLM